ncbi:MAG: ROK family protein [Pseudomonadota bacterium]
MARLIGGVEAGGTKFVCAIGERPDRIRDRVQFPTTTPAETFSEVSAFFERNLRAGDELVGVGLAAFGPIDVRLGSPTYGRVKETPKEGWRGADYIAALAGLGAPVRVDTDVNGAGLGEFLYGAGKGAATLAYVTVGTGIGAGVLQGGVPVMGFAHMEIGHIRPPREPGDAFEGVCPYHGDCLEGLASGPAILGRWGRKLSDPAIDPRAIEMEAGYLAHLASALVLTHAPDRIVFGGGVMMAPGILTALWGRTAEGLGGYVAHAAVAGDLAEYLVPPSLGDLAGVTGALALGRAAAAEG